MRLAIAGLVLALVMTSAFARDTGSTYDPSSHSFYHATDGARVHGPTRQANPDFGRVSAVCRDGTNSYSHHHRGTCSGHGGVEAWR